MLYKQDIAQLALGHLGSSLSLIDLEVEQTTQAKIIRRHFRMSLDTMLEKHEWGFATQFSALVLHDEDPLLAYKYAYALPADCLVLRMIAEDGYFPERKLYEDEKKKFREIYNGAGPRLIYTNVLNAHGEYTTRLPEDMAFPTHFARGLSFQLALDIGPQLITNNYPKIQSTLLATSRNEISNAISYDLARQPQLEDSLSPFVRARQI